MTTGSSLNGGTHTPIARSEFQRISWGPSAMLRGAPAAAALRHFTHTVDGTRYQGYFRPTTLECIEVIAVGLIKTIALYGRSPLDVAREALEELLLIRQHLGWPSVDSVDDSAQTPQQPFVTIPSTDTT
jgi:hypothetical protein